jgi:hypothetical protein
MMQRFFTLFPPSFLLRLFLVWLCIVLPAAWLLSERWPVWVDHVLRAMLLDMVTAQIWQGDFYPRWLIEANAGLGSPVAIFQPLTSFYLALPLQFLRDLDPHGYGRLMMVNATLIFLGGMAMYRWLSEHMDHTSAQAGAMLYVAWGSMGALLSGYSAGLCVFLIIPLFMLTAKKLSENPFYYIPHYALVLMALILSHLPSTLVFSAVPALYALLLAASKNRLRLIIALGICGLIALAISAIYWLPLFANTQFIRYDRYVGGFFTAEVHFPRLIKHPWHPTSFYWGQIVGVIVNIVIFLSTVLMVRRARPFEEQKRLVIFFLAVYLFGLFMLLPLSRWFWENIDIIKNLQFSARFWILISLPMIFLLSQWFYKLRGHYFCYPLIIAATIAMFFFQANHRYSGKHQEFWERVATHNLIPHAAHMTHAMRRAGIKDPMNPPAQFLSVPESKVLKGEATIENVNQDPYRITAEIDVSSPSAEIALKRFYYPGWKILSPAAPKIDIIQRGALLTLRVPRGEHQIEMVQHIPKVREANLISLAGLGILLMIAGFVRRYKPQPQ